MASVRYLPDAEEDLFEIWRHVLEDSQSFETADRLIDTIDDACGEYARQPLMGVHRPDLSPQVRCFVVASYVVFYVPLQNGIEVIQVIHGARDVPAHFRRPRKRSS